MMTSAGLVLSRTDCCKKLSHSLRTLFFFFFFFFFFVAWVEPVLPEKGDHVLIVGADVDEEMLGKSGNRNFLAFFWTILSF